jgi:hypothetical protein
MLLSITDFAKMTGHSKCAVENVIKNNGIEVVATENVGRFPRRMYNPQPTLDILKEKKLMTKHGPKFK